MIPNFEIFISPKIVFQKYKISITKNFIFDCIKFSSQIIFSNHWFCHFLWFFFRPRTPIAEDQDTLETLKLLMPYDKRNDLKSFAVGERKLSFNEITARRWCSALYFREVLVYSSYFCKLWNYLIFALQVVVGKRYDNFQNLCKSKKRVGPKKGLFCFYRRTSWLLYGDSWRFIGRLTHP